MEYLAGQMEYLSRRMEHLAGQMESFDGQMEHLSGQMEHLDGLMWSPQSRREGMATPPAAPLASRSSSLDCGSVATDVDPAAQRLCG